ncbi:hypothetical protein FIBSPDRAFT_882193 [Athelia psychrophila]|uniref:Uncharacterized protein n=1 Tax=Athelia psychrophila TaxID=1759441 RepID=A0A166VMD5_9AGAM|nr:hypothetical protein FIBSPDRAFT_882193 [Fibularhizoctonia sp. CBS 109695]
MVRNKRAILIVIVSFKALSNEGTSSLRTSDPSLATAPNAPSAPMDTPGSLCNSRIDTRRLDCDRQPLHTPQLTVLDSNNALADGLDLIELASSLGGNASNNETNYAGARMNMYGRVFPAVVHVAVQLNASDVPACWKLNGAHCSGPHAQEFKMRDDRASLKHAELSRLSATSDKARKKILDESGMRCSEFNQLPGWMPSQLTVVDYMHNFYGDSLSLRH